MFKKGTKRPKEFKERMSKILKERGIQPSRHAIELGRRFNTGRQRPQEVRDKISKSHIGLPSKVSGDINYAWKGDKVSYVGLHQWVSRWKGKPKMCEMCGSTSSKKYQWANIDHKYRRVLEDFIRLCIPCHVKYDNEKN